MNHPVQFLFVSSFVKSDTYAPRSRLSMETSRRRAATSFSISKSRRLSKEMYSIAKSNQSVTNLCLHPRVFLPLLRISHLLVFKFFSTGNESRSSSNNSFISLRRLRSANLWLTRNSGLRE